MVAWRVRLSRTATAPARESDSFSLTKCEELVRLLGTATSVEARELHRVAAQRLCALQQFAHDDDSASHEDPVDAAGLEDVEWYDGGQYFEDFDDCSADSVSAVSS